MRIEDGWFTPPDQPGIVFDRAALAAHTVEA
jgi:L-alanine-DL-glutamate epimerase-like enolase superfamily enzyme